MIRDLSQPLKMTLVLQKLYYPEEARLSFFRSEIIWFDD
jgi:hypothetical protein